MRKLRPKAQSQRLGEGRELGFKPRTVWLQNLLLTIICSAEKEICRKEGDIEYEVSKMLGNFKELTLMMMMK